MVVKLFEIRDEGTHIPAMAVSIAKSDGYPASRAGFGDSRYILLTNLLNMHCQYDPYKWENSEGRTMSNAHVFISNHWDRLENEDVIDVQFILGETNEKKVSERMG